jgi:hypothetical protein
MTPNPLLDFMVAEHERFDELITKFGSYQPRDVTLPRLQIWLQQFHPRDYSLALRVLEAVEFYDLARLHKLLKSLHRELRTLTSEAGFRKLKDLIFCPIGNNGSYRSYLATSLGQALAPSERHECNPPAQVIQNSACGPSAEKTSRAFDPQAICLTAPDALDGPEAHRTGEIQSVATLNSIVQLSQSLTRSAES